MGAATLHARRILTGLAACGLVAACTDPEIVLPGTREDIRAALVDPEPVPVSSEAFVSTARAFAPGPATRNAAWPQHHGLPSARTSHPALTGTLAPLWQAGIGQGDKRRARITADPVAENGRIFTLDSATMVTATAASGETLWQVPLVPERDRADQAVGGALALGGGRLYVATAFGELTALDPATGQELWTQRLQTTGTGAPSYYDGLVYVVAGDTTAWAIEADSGRIRWQIDGLADLNNFSGGPAPVVTDQYAVFAFGSGELQAAFRKGGLRLWTASLAGQRDALALSTVDDITGDPVIVGDTLYAGNVTGSFVALGLSNGERRWTAQMGATGPAWVAGDSVFVVSDRNALVRLDSASGEKIWEVQLPGYVERRRPQRSRDAAHVNHGPVLAGGRLIVASSDGLIRQFAPEDGRLLGTVELPGGATTAPIVVDGTLYVVTSKGNLAAFR